MGLSIDREHLRPLDIGSRAPPHLLMALDFELLSTTSSDGSSQWDCRESAVVMQFLNITDGLEKVVVNSFDSVKFDEVRDSFLENHDRR